MLVTQHGETLLRLVSLLLQVREPILQLVMNGLLVEAFLCNRCHLGLHALTLVLDALSLSLLLLEEVLGPLSGAVVVVKLLAEGCQLLLSLRDSLCGHFFFEAFKVAVLAHDLVDEAGTLLNIVLAAVEDDTLQSLVLPTQFILPLLLLLDQLVEGSHLLLKLRELARILGAKLSHLRLGVVTDSRS